MIWLSTPTRTVHPEWKTSPSGGGNHEIYHPLIDKYIRMEQKLNEFFTS